MLALPLSGSTPELYHGKYVAGMYGSGEQGVWYEPSLSNGTLFQDAAGTTPVTAVEQAVGLMLDKRKGLVLGPELVVNGGFDIDASWVKDAGWSIANGVAKFSGTSYSAIRQNLTLIPGKSYQIEAVYSSITAGGSIAGLGGIALLTATAATSYKAIFTAVTASNDLTFEGNLINGVRFAGSISSISVKEIPGNHAKQTTSADRPVFSARYNLLTATEDITVTPWGSNRVTKTKGLPDPDGGNTACAVYETTETGSHWLDGYGYAFLPSVAIKRTVYLKYADRQYVLVGSNQNIEDRNVCVDLINNTVVATGVSVLSSSITLYKDGWCKVEFVINISSTAQNTISIVTRTTVGTTGESYTGDPTKGVLIWRPSCVPANQASLPYQRVNTATDYDADPVKFPPYLKFNGTNSGMVTNSIDFTATDKMTVFCGDSCAWDNKPRVLFGLGGNVNSTNPGVFWLMAFDGGGSAASALYLRQSLRTVAIFNPNLTTLGFRTNVRAASLDISAATRADEIKMRVNGATSTVNTYANDASAGDGNFTANQLYIGASFGGYRFNGNLYSLIIRGAATDDAHLTHAEKYVAYKSGLVI